MTHPHLSRLATELLRDEDLRVEQSTPADDALAIDAIERAIAAGRRKRRLRLAAVAASLGLAASVILGVEWRMHSHSPAGPVATSAPGSANVQVEAIAHALSEGVVLERDGREVAIGSGTALAPRDRVVTSASGRLAMSLATGTHLVVGVSSDLVIAEQGLTLAFALSAGSVTADVATLRPGERFIVRTVDGEVEVRGTSFEVRVVDPSPTCGAGTRTRVVVTEGTVVVRASGREDRVHKGESWPRDCASPPVTGALVPAPVVPAPVVATPVVATPVVATPVVATPLAAPATPLAAPPGVDAVASARGSSSSAAVASGRAGAAPAESDLAAQNALLAEASAARRRGDRSAALAAYDRFLEKYPGSQLAESAYVERMRLLAASDPRRGAEAARAYVARFPRGFARAEATDLIANGR